jgi:hypothetical protein
MAFLLANPFETCARIAVRNDSILLTFSFDGVYVYQPQLNGSAAGNNDFLHFYLVLVPVLLMAFLSTNLS